MRPCANRRALMRYLLAAALAGMVPVTGARAMAGRRVVVIGAGISGLAAAQRLKAEGAQVTVLEARTRVGGRIATDFSLGAPFELGAGWIHGPSPDNPVRQLADAVDAKTFVTEDDNLALYDAKGGEIPDDRLDAVDRDWERILDWVDENLEETDQRSLEKAIAKRFPEALKDPLLRWALSAYTEFDNGAPLGDLSAVWHDDDDVFDEPDVVITTGYAGILEPLMEGLEIRLGSAVSAVRYGKKGVAVETADGSLHDADFCICSVPLGVLKAGLAGGVGGAAARDGTISFDPALPKAHRQAIGKLGFGSVTKIAMKFPAPFWDIETQYFGVAPADAGRDPGRWCIWLNYRTFSDENILLGLSVGAYAPKADRMTNREMTADALGVLREVWGEAVPAPSAVLTTRWATDPHALGAYSYPAPGSSPKDYDRLAMPIAGRLVLCGEHCNFRYKGTVHGAYLSGLVAAKRILEQ